MDVVVSPSVFGRSFSDVLNNPNFIVFGAKNRQNNNVIVYAKNMNDGSTLYVEERRTRSKHLAANTLYKMTSASDANTLLRNPTLYAQDDRGSIKIVDVKSELVNNNISNISFQQVFHGTPHYFDTFSTESIGTGEGAQSFGWGLYFTNQEGITRYYADKLANSGKRISLVAKKDFLKSRKKALKDVENKEKYEAKIYKNIKEFTKELKQAQKAGDEGDIKFYQGLIDDSMKQLDEKERQDLIESFKKELYHLPFSEGRLA